MITSFEKELTETAEINSAVSIQPYKPNSFKIESNVYFYVSTDKTNWEKIARYENTANGWLDGKFDLWKYKQ